MSIRHEQLKKNVDVSRFRFEKAREKRLESVKLHKRHKRLNVALWVVSPISAGLLAMTFPLWVLVLWCVFFGFVSFWCWTDVIMARKDIDAWRERELQQLSDVVDDIQALVDRETLQLMDPEAYARIEAPPVKPKKERSAEHQAAQQLQEAVERQRQQTMRAFGMPDSYSTRNEYVTQSTVKHGKVVKRYIHVATGHVDYERIERW